MYIFREHAQGGTLFARSHFPKSRARIEYFYRRKRIYARDVSKRDTERRRRKNPIDLRLLK